MNKLTIQKANPYNATITVTNVSTGAPYDLTGKTVFFTVKKKDDEEADDSKAIIQKTITVHTSPTLGITTLSLAATDTNVPLDNYIWDLRVYQAGLVQMNTARAPCEVVNIVTKRTS
jgi:hypothetical protein